MPPSTPTYNNNTPILKRVVETIEKHAMFTGGDKVLVGVSGGPDSVALLHLLHGLTPVYQLELGVAHLNHGLRPLAAHQEAAYVEQLAISLDLAFYSKQISLDGHQGSVEEKARQARYQFLNELADTHGYTKIALGHQANDDAESVMLHLLRGSGLRGLSGIPPVRGRRIVRPLIDLYRTDIMSYLEHRNIHYMEDYSNTDLRYDRNRIRHHLLPLLREHYNVNISKTLHRMAGLCRDEDLWLDAHLQPLLSQMETRKTPQCLELDIDLLGDQSLAVQRRLIRSALRRWQGHLKRIAAGHVDAIITLSLSHRPRGCLNLPAGLAAQRKGNRLQFTVLNNPRRFPSNPITSFCYTLASAQQLPPTVTIAEAGIVMTFAITAPPDLHQLNARDQHVAWFDMTRLEFPLYLRSAQPGDRMDLLGTTGSQKVNKFLINNKIPSDQRPQIPILASADTIYWVVGLRRSSAALIGPSTNQALCIRCRKQA